MEQAPRQAPDPGGLQPALALDQHLFDQAASLLQQGQLQPAQALYAELLQRHPAHFDCLQRLGWIAAQSKDYALAVDYGCRAIEAKPQSALAYLDVGSAMFGLGQYQASLECLDLAISLDAKCAQAYNNRGLALKALKQPQAAEASFQTAIALDPSQAQAWLNLGTLQRQLDRHEEALASYDQAIALQPGYAQAFFNRGNVLQDLGRLDEAIAHFDQALVLEPGMADVHWNKAVCLLLGGHYAAAWPLYEWRWVNHQATAASPVDSLPVWDGRQSLAGKTLLVQSEQGLGDTSVAHLSGALGVPCWVLVAHSPDWRWLLGRKDCVWYRKTQIYRQPQAGRWDSVLQEVARDLRLPGAFAAIA